MWNLCMMCHGIHTYYAPEIYRVHRASERGNTIRIYAQSHECNARAETVSLSLAGFLCGIPLLGLCLCSSSAYALLCV